MTRVLTAFGLFALLLFVHSPATSGASNDSPLRIAELAWEQGDYPAALTAFLQLLNSPQVDAVLEPIALRTGELYRTIEITPDGALPQFAPDDKHFLYETGTGRRRLTRVLTVDEPAQPFVELPGWGAAFSPDGTSVAYIRTPNTPEVAAAESAVDSAAPADRAQRVAALTTLLNTTSRVVLRELASGRETVLDTGTLAKTSLLVAAGNVVIFTGAPAANVPVQIYSVTDTQAAAPITTGDDDKTIVAINSPGTALLYISRPRGTGRGGRGGAGSRGGDGRGAGAPPPPAVFHLMSVPDGRTVTIDGTAPAFSRDGRSIAFVRRTATEQSVMIAAVADPSTATAVRTGPERVDFPALSADGSRVAYQVMARDDWEIYTAARDGSGELRLTRDPQHDILPQFLGTDRLLTVVGEARHRRSFMYDLGSGQQTRLFHNNTVRTVAPEYLWEPTADGTKMLVVAERDGNTVSTERGVYLMDLTRKVTREEVRDRVAASLSAEQALRARGKRIFQPIAEAVKGTVAEASTARIYSYEKALFGFDSKHITRPGNKRASAYLFDTYKSFGYAPELQWFARENALGGQTANVLARLQGTESPELIYVVSSHYDSVATGPGADDDSSGTAALLETARILAGRPQPATILFASFTGEEAGLLGSREFVRRAVADKLKIVGALNNDMVGWANDHRLDNTIRYSNPGIRDIQHAAAIHFTNLITYDALYYKGTDAAAYYEAFGDIVGGIGSYPVLSSPHYHQPHDLLENMNHQLITEVAKTTAATLMMLASSPSRLTDLKVDAVTGGTATISWTPSPEKGVNAYLVAYGPPEKPGAHQMRVTKPTAVLSNVSPGTLVAVKAVNAKGLEGWDWARLRIESK